MCITVQIFIISLFALWSHSLDKSKLPAQNKRYGKQAGRAHIACKTYAEWTKKNAFRLLRLSQESNTEPSNVMLCLVLTHQAYQNSYKFNRLRASSLKATSAEV